MGNVVYLAAKKSPVVRSQGDQDLIDAPRVTMETACQLLAIATALEANIDLADRIVDQIDDPVCREALRKQNSEDRCCLKASIEELRQKIGTMECAARVDPSSQSSESDLRLGAFRRF